MIEPSARVGDCTNCLYDADSELAITLSYGGAYGGQYTGNDQTSSIYDANGNPTGTGVVIGAGNRLLSDGTYNYTYDAAGNMASQIAINGGAGMYFGYDTDNRLSNVVLKNASQQVTANVSLTYDLYGQLIGRSATTYAYSGGNTYATTTTGHFVYDPVTHDMALAFDGNSNLTNRFLYGPAVDEILAQENVSSPLGANTTWMVTNYQGSVVNDLWQGDTQYGSVPSSNVSYSPFGQTNFAGGLFFGYTGAYTDPLTGLQYHSVGNDGRWYSTSADRWLKPDPSGLGPDSNPYRYAGNDPMNETDPTGLSASDDNETFNRQMGVMQSAMDALKTRLAAIGNQLNGLNNGAANEVDISDSDLDDISYQMNKWAQAYESVSDTISRGNISDADRSAFYSVLGPNSLGLNVFTNAGAIQRNLASSQITQQNDVSREARLDTTATILRDGEIVGNIAGIATGGLIIAQAAKCGGKWAVAKAVGTMAAGYAASQLGESTARALGADETTIRAIRLASTVVSLILLHRSGGCFVAGTPVAMETGHKAIEDIRVDDSVWSFDLASRQWKLCRVIDTYKTEYVGEKVSIKVGNEWIESTRHHPVWAVEGKDLDSRPRPGHVRRAETTGVTVAGRWVDAGDLLVGDMLLLKPDRRAIIEDIKVEPIAANVYNFQVQGFHNYAVGFGCVLVHNTALCPIEGKAQVTGTPGHDTTSLEIAAEEAASPDAARVHMNQKLSTITDGAVDSGLQPDVATVHHDGTIDVIEIPSASQTPEQMQAKVDRMEDLLGDLAGPNSRVEKIR